MLERIANALAEIAVSALETIACAVVAANVAAVDSVCEFIAADEPALDMSMFDAPVTVMSAERSFERAMRNADLRDARRLGAVA